MRCRHILLAVAFAIPTALTAQSGPRATHPEKFDVSGLPAKASSTLEQEIFTLLRYHRRGDLRDAARIHLKLAEYYKEIGDKVKADDCTKMASEAWEAAESGVKVTAGSPGKPPFEPERTFKQNFAYTDPDLGTTHRWEFYDDGTYSHSLPAPAGSSTPPPKELGWYQLLDGQIRLWQVNPALDRTIPFVLIGDGGKGGATMEGTKMRAVR